MTVCVAAVGGFQNAVIVAVDQMLTLQQFTGDLPEFSKGMRVHPRWFAMYSGDVTQAPQILTRATNLLGRYVKPRVERVTDIFLKVYNDHRKRILAQGATEFEIDFLVAGFDSNGAARIFSIKPPGIEGRHEIQGFWAIGSGCDLAMESLMRRQYKTFQSLDDQVYLVAEAKFVAEAVLGIGAKTAMAVILKDGSIALITKQRSEKIREIWLNEAQPPMPEKLGERIPPIMGRFGKAPVTVNKQTRKRKPQAKGAKK